MDMKKIQSKYVRIAIAVVITGAALYAIMSIIDNIGVVWSSLGVAARFVIGMLLPVIIGFVIAFILSRPSAWVERKLKGTKLWAKRKRGAALMGAFIAFAGLLGLLALFIWLLAPGVVESVRSISRNLPGYAQSAYTWLQDISANPTIAQIMQFAGVGGLDSGSFSEAMTQYWSVIAGFAQDIATALLGFVVNTGKFLYNFVLGFFFAVYMLVYREEIKRQLGTFFRHLFPRAHWRALFVVRVSDDLFYRFLVGKGLCSLGVGVVTFGACALLGFHYSPLISLIMAVTNMIPMFGPIFGTVAAMLLSLMTAPEYAVYMLIIAIVVQILEGNVIGPRVLGDSIGINGFWIMLSIILMGALFGVFGMLIAAPLFGVLRILIKNWMHHRQNGLLEGEEEFRASMERYREWSAKRSNGGAESAS
jgi:predicted PurR-regulated permease PerM